MDYHNLVKIHQRQAEQRGTGIAVRFKRDGRYQDVTWGEYRADALASAAALTDVGIRPGDRVGILSENRVEWLLADLGILTAAAVNVPPHTPLTARQVHFQMTDASVRWLFVSDAVQLDKVRQVRGDLAALAGIVVFDPSCAGDGVPSWEEFLQRGRKTLGRLGEELARRETALGSDDLATIVYTSFAGADPAATIDPSSSDLKIVPDSDLSSAGSSTVQAWRTNSCRLRRAFSAVSRRRLSSSV